MQFRVIMVIDPPTHKHTHPPTNKQTNRQYRLQYTVPQLARSVIIVRQSWHLLLRIDNRCLYGKIR